MGTTGWRGVKEKPRRTLSSSAVICRQKSSHWLNSKHQNCTTNIHNFSFRWLCVTRNPVMMHPEQRGNRADGWHIKFCQEKTPKCKLCVTPPVRKDLMLPSTEGNEDICVSYSEHKAKVCAICLMALRALCCVMSPVVRDAAVFCFTRVLSSWRI